MTFRVEDISIDSPDPSIIAQAKRVWDTRVKPPGSFGFLEEAVATVCAVQKTLSPDFSSPAAILFAGDHHIIAEGVSNSLQEVTWQQTLNFASGGGAFGRLCALHSFSSLVVDVGVNHTFSPSSPVIDRKTAFGASNFLTEEALGIEGAIAALKSGMESLDLLDSPVDLLVLGEMGVGNTSSAAALTSLFLGIDSSESVGRGAGLDDTQLTHKREIISRAVELYGHLKDPIDILSAVGGYEIAAMAGAMLEAARRKIIILLDGYVASSALLAAHRINEKVSEYVIAGHLGSERGQKAILSSLSLTPLLSLGMFPGEGAGALLAYPLLKQGISLFNTLESFSDAEVNDRANRTLAGGSFS